MVASGGTIEKIPSDTTGDNTLTTTLPQVPFLHQTLNNIDKVGPRNFGLFNRLKPTGYVMHHKFNIQQLYALPTLYLCVLYLSETNSDLCHLQHKLIGFYNRDEKCLLPSTDCVFK